MFQGVHRHILCFVNQEHHGPAFPVFVYEDEMQLFQHCGIVTLNGLVSQFTQQGLDQVGK